MRCIVGKVCWAASAAQAGVFVRGLEEARSTRWLARVGRAAHGREIGSTQRQKTQSLVVGAAILIRTDLVLGCIFSSSSFRVHYGQARTINGDSPQLGVYRITNE
jgi:hypothetical protein